MKTLIEKIKTLRLYFVIKRFLFKEWSVTFVTIALFTLYTLLHGFGYGCLMTLIMVSLFYWLGRV